MKEDSVFLLEVTVSYEKDQGVFIVCSTAKWAKYQQLTKEAIPGLEGKKVEVVLIVVGSGGIERTIGQWILTSKEIEV